MSGTLAARVLADHFQQVTIIERDQFPEQPEPRKGVPQSRHLHVMLVRGRRILQAMFPGLHDELIAAGAQEIDWMQEAEVMVPSGWLPHYPSPLRTYVCSRELWDWLVGQRVRALPNVRVITGAEVCDLLTTPDKQRVIGVRLRPHGAGSQSDLPETLTADFVVDAAGRASHLPDWLTALGYERPQTTTVNSLLGYATRVYEPSPDFKADWKAVLIGTVPTSNPRAGVLMPIENGRWMVTLAGIGGAYPPTDEAGFIEFTAQLAAPLIYNAIKQARPVTPIYGYRRTENQWRHYEKLRRWPQGVVAMGDAVCGFNPFYGQGMTVSAMTAEALHQFLQQTPDPATKAFTFQKQVARVVRMPWLMATSEDFRWPNTQGDPPGVMTRLLHRYLDEVIKLLPTHRRVALAFFSLNHLIAPPTALFRPYVTGAVMWQVVKRAMNRLVSA